MEVPEIFRGMKKVKEYPNYVLYKKTITDVWGKEHKIRECFTYWDLGFATKQVRDRKVNAGWHL